MRAILRENMANYISLESLKNVDIGKKYQLPVFFNSAKENCKNDCENDHASFNQTDELIGTKIRQISVKFALNIP